MSEGVVGVASPQTLVFIYNGSTTVSSYKEAASGKMHLSSQVHSRRVIPKLLLRGKQI